MVDERARFERLLDSILRELGLDLVPDQVTQLYNHYCLLARWNERMNLTSLRRLEDVVSRHVGESLLVAKVIGRGTGAVVDVGSGAGFPGVPVAVCLSDREVTLVESVSKKATFLKEVARSLPNVRVFGGRFEDLAGQFEWASIRAVAGAALRADLSRTVSKVAIVGSASSVGEMVGDLGLSVSQTLGVPWDARTVLVAGGVPRGTGTIHP